MKNSKFGSPEQAVVLSLLVLLAAAAQPAFAAETQHKLPCKHHKIYGIPVKKHPIHGIPVKKHPVLGLVHKPVIGLPTHQPGITNGIPATKPGLINGIPANQQQEH